MRNKHTMEIAAPAEVVFEWIDEPERVMQWLGHVVEYERADETQEKVGTRVRQVWDDAGHRTELNGHVTAYEPGQRLGIELAGDGVKVKVDYTLRDLGGRTELSQETDMRYMGLLGVIDMVAGPLLRKSYRGELERNFARLAKLCERA